MSVLLACMFLDHIHSWHQNSVLYVLELELQIEMTHHVVLETEPGSPGRASTVNYWAISPDSKFNILNSILKSPISFSKFVFVLPNRNCCFTNSYHIDSTSKCPFYPLPLKMQKLGTSHSSSGLDLVPNTPTPLATTWKFQVQRIQHSLLASTGTHIHILIHRHICIIKNKKK